MNLTAREKWLMRMAWIGGRFSARTTDRSMDEWLAWESEDGTAVEMGLAQEAPKCEAFCAGMLAAAEIADKSSLTGKYIGAAIRKAAQGGE